MLMFIMATVSEPNEQKFMVSLFEDYHRLMFATAKKYVSNYHAVEDIVQESLMNLLKKIHTIMSLERCSLAAYIVCTVRNTSINYLKKERTQKRYLSPDPVEGSDAEISPAPSIEELLLVKENLHTLASVMNQLSEEERLLLDGRYILGLTDEEIAEVIKCKPSSVRMKLTRVRRKTFAMIKQMEGDMDDETRDAS